MLNTDTKQCCRQSFSSIDADLLLKLLEATFTQHELVWDDSEFGEPSA